MLTAVLAAAVLSSAADAAFVVPPKPKQVEKCRIEGDARCALDEQSLVLAPQGPGATSEEITPPSGDTGGGMPIDIDHIINTALKVWDIIVKNKAVVDIKTQYAVALPQGITNWGQLSSWRPPEGTVYGFYAKNKFGQTVVNVRYLVTRTYGGAYKGKGKYLTAVTIEPLNVDVMWGYKFSLAAEAPQETIGNFGTDEDPIAGMQIRVKWNVETPVKNSTGTSIYFVEGDGTFREDASPFPHGIASTAAPAVLEAAALQLP